MSKYCKGCESYNQFCSFTEDNEEGDCPCTNCLVKVPCDGTQVCKLWDDWAGIMMERKKKK